MLCIESKVRSRGLIRNSPCKTYTESEHPQVCFLLVQSLLMTYRSPLPVSLCSKCEESSEDELVTCFNTFRIFGIFPWSSGDFLDEPGIANTASKSRHFQLPPQPLFATVLPPRLRPLYHSRREAFNCWFAMLSCNFALYGEAVTNVYDFYLYSAWKESEWVLYVLGKYAKVHQQGYFYHFQERLYCPISIQWRHEWESEQNVRGFTLSAHWIRVTFQLLQKVKI